MIPSHKIVVVEGDFNYLIVLIENARHALHAFFAESGFEFYKVKSQGLSPRGCRSRFLEVSRSIPIFLFRVRGPS